MIDINAAGTSELLPLIDVVTVLAPDHESVVVSIGNKESSRRIDGDRMRRTEFLVTLSGYSEMCDKRTVW